MNTIKAGVLLPHTRLYGGVKRFIELGRVFVASGHSFTLYTPDGKPPVWTKNDLRVATFEDLLREENDMLFITDRKYKDFIFKARATYKIFYHVSLHHKARSLVRDKRLLTFACSSNIARYDRWVFGVKPFLAAGGINTSLYYPRDTNTARPDETLTVLIYGRLFERVKGTELAVRACEKLHSKFPFIRLLLFDTPVNESAREAIENFSTHVPYDFITNHPVEDNVSLFHRADIFVSAEKGAGWANTVAEAMASGVPVVGTRSGTSDILLHMKTGIVVRRNVRSIARGIRKLIRSGELREELAQNALAHIALYEWNHLGQRIIRWYEEKEADRKETAKHG
jgi:glycosyltransferase involved in cell wall biosynthesis